MSDELSARIDALAQALGRSRSWVIAHAIERYVEEELEFLEFVQEGVRDIEAGRSFSQEEVERMFLSDRVQRDAA